MEQFQTDIDRNRPAPILQNCNSTKTSSEYIFFLIGISPYLKELPYILKLSKAFNTIKGE